MTKFGVFTIDGFTWIARPAHPDDRDFEYYCDTRDEAIEAAAKLAIDQHGRSMHVHHMQDQTDGSHGFVPFNPQPNKDQQ